MLPLLAGVAARGLATRAGMGALGQAAAGAGAQFGTSSLMKGHQNSQQATQQKHDHGITNYIRQNPVESVVGGALYMAQHGTMRDQAQAATEGLLQSTQFK